MSVLRQRVEIPCVLEGDCLEVLKGAGVEFLEGNLSCKNSDERDERRLPLLQLVCLPDGWSLKVSGNCEKRLYDNRGRIRAKMLRGSAFWDQWADMRACGRFHIVCEAYTESRRPVFTVRDGNEDGPVVFTSSQYGRHSPAERDAVRGTAVHTQLIDEDNAESERALGECERWLEANYPKWRDKSAYWD